ncbi:MAG TPA: HEAT repeat domain-containing protein, partial [Candidatus Binatia bacterium]|nr:HEAT repeat domain-containing protein [Candidatus Binatia bacterium]
WVHQWHNVVDNDLLQRMLHSPDPHARTAATRVLCYWRDRVPNTLALLAEAAVDEHPRVRLEAIRAASFFKSIDAANVALAALKYPTDYYINYTLKETLRQLEPAWRKALLSGDDSLAADNPKGLDHLVRSIKSSELENLPRTARIQQAVLSRPELTDAQRVEALDVLATERKSSRVTELFAALDRFTKTDPATAANLARLLGYQTAADLKPMRSRIAALTASDQANEVRYAAWAALAQGDQSFDSVWSDASKSPDRLADLLNGIPYVVDAEFRGTSYEKVSQALRGDKAVRSAAIRAVVSLNRDQQSTFNTLAAMVDAGDHVTEAGQGIRALPRSAWDKNAAGEVANALLAWAKTIPAKSRTKQDYIETVQLASDLAGLLPKDKASAVRSELRDLSVPTFVVRTVREQMRYDTPRIVVEPGKALEIILENADFMPHNLVVVKPGKREKVANAATLMKPEDEDGRGRAYVPKGSDILAATRLIEPGQRATLSMTAPHEEGQYEYVCTYPNHWMMMWGQLIVAKDIEGYLQKHPIAELPAPVAAAEHQH